MSLLDWASNGFGTLLGVLAEKTAQVIASVKSGYNAYRERGGPIEQNAAQAADDTNDKLRELNDEMMALRKRNMDRENRSEEDMRRLARLREERDALLAELNALREVKSAEKIIETEATIEKVEIDLDTTHVLQYNSFADTINKRCSKCGRRMKIQWERGLLVVKPEHFFWGCTGWYVPQQGHPACTQSEKIRPEEYALMTDMSVPEFSVTADDFATIIADPGTQDIVAERLVDLHSDLKKTGGGIELATCPIHGETMVMRRKTDAVGLMDTYFLTCPRWLPRAKGEGCPFMEKLKSPSQLAALLKSQTGRGVL